MKMSLINKVEQFNDDVDIAHQIVHGDSTTTVTTEGGPVRSLAKLIADKDAEFVGGNIVQQAVAARDDSEAARDVAVLAKDAAMVGAVTYPDEATGRAAVADGGYFKVIGSGDVAAREYRRTDPSTSVLVAEYPSLMAYSGVDVRVTALENPITLSPAEALMGDEIEGIAIDVTNESDSREVKVVDLVTPSNNFHGDIGTLLPAAYKAPKLVIDKNGDLNWTPHNHLPRSEYLNLWAKGASLVSEKNEEGLFEVKASATTSGGANININAMGVLTDYYYSLTIIAKFSTSNYIRLGFDSNKDAYFNFSTGNYETVDATLIASKFTTYEDGTPLPEGEWRLVVTGKNDTPSGLNVAIAVCDSDNNRLVTVDKSIYVRRASLVRGVRLLSYIKTDETAKYTPSYDYSKGGRRLFVENCNTVFPSLWSDDLTNSVWIKTGIAASLDATGPTGEPCSTVMALSTNATCIQNITSIHTVWTFQAHIRRKVGVGSVFMTADGGATWTDVTDQIVTDKFSRVWCYGTGANPSIGFKLAEAGDTLEVSLALAGHYGFLTSPTPTYGDSITRLADEFKIPLNTLAGPEMSIYLDFDYNDNEQGKNRPEIGLNRSGLTHYIEFHADYVRLSSSQSWLSNLLAGKPDGSRIEAAFRLKDNEFAGSAFGYGETYESKATIDGVNTIFAGGIRGTLYIRRILFVPRALPDDHGLARWRYSGLGADARYLDDVKVAKFGELPGTGNNREPAVEVLYDDANTTELIVANMQRNIVNNTGHSELPARIVGRKFIFDKNTKLITPTTETYVLAQQDNWVDGLGHQQGPCLIKIRQGALKGRLLLLYAQLDSVSGTLTDDHRVIYQQYSDDNGITWSEPIKIYDAGVGTATIITCGDYVQFLEGPFKGRICVPVYGSAVGSRVIYSDDSGASWTPGGASGLQFGEATLSQLPNDITIVMSIRSGTTRRQFAKSSDGGMSWIDSGNLDGDFSSVGMTTVQADPNGGKGLFGELVLIGPRSDNPIRTKMAIERLSGYPLVLGGNRFYPLGEMRTTGYSSGKRISGGYIAIAYETATVGSMNTVMDVRLMIVRWP